MRVRKLLLVVVLFHLFLLPVSGQWKIISEGRPIVSFDLIDDMTAWIAGNDGSLMQTTDGGETWIDLAPGNENPDFKCIDFVNDTLGWALSYYQIYRTTNGGRSWEQQQVPSLPWKKLCMLDENCGYAISGNTLYKTVDSKTWKQVQVKNGPTMDELSFLDPETGVVIAHDYYTSCAFSTTNGGESWVSHDLGSSIRPTSLQFSPDSQIYFLLEGSLFRTDDFFEHYENISPEEGETILAFCLQNDDDILAFRGSRVVFSTDGGETWNIRGYNGMPMGFRDNRVCIKCFQETCYALNPELIFLKNQNRDLDWQVLSIQHSLYDVSFWDPNRGFIIGGPPRIGHSTQGGNIYQTLNGGRTWTISRTFDYCRPDLGSAMDRSSALVGMTGGRGSCTICTISTNNRGQSWIEPSEENDETTPGCIADIYFENPESGCVLSIETEVVFKTSDGGSSWEMFFESPEHFEPKSVCFINSTGWIAGSDIEGSLDIDGSLIIKFTSSGNWHTIDVGTDLPLNKVFFINEKEGWLSGGYISDDGSQTFFARTKNGGETWDVSSGFGYILYDVWFRNTQVGWAAGSDRQGKGVLLTTLNGGNSWTPVLDSLPEPLYALHMTDTFGIAVGDNGLIVGNTDSTLTGLNDKPGALPGDQMLRLMPNPFSTFMQLQYEVLEPSRVEITIYSINGIKTETLVHEWHLPGNYELRWNPSGHAPGVYFCELRTGQYREIQKMILLK